MFNPSSENRIPSRESDFLAASMAFAGSLVFALLTYFLIVLRIRFPHTMLDDVVGYGSMHLYSHPRALLIYLLALTLVPALTLTAYRGWLLWSRRLARMAGGEAFRIRRISALPYLLWLVVIPHMNLAERVFPILAGLFLASQGLIALWAILLSRFIPDRLLRPAPLTHLGVLLSGTAPAFFILYSPRFGAIHRYGLWVVFFCAAAVWLFWWVFSALLSWRTRIPLEHVVAADAFSYFPFTVLGLIPVFNFIVISQGEIIPTYSIPHAGKILFGIAVGGFLIIKVALLSRSRRTDPVALSKKFRKLLMYLVIPLWIYSLSFLPNIHGNIDLFHEGERLAPAHGIMRGGFPFRDVVYLHGLGEDPGKTLLGFRLFGTDLAGFRRAVMLIEPLRFVVLYIFGMAFFRSLPWALGLVAFDACVGEPLGMIAINGRSMWGYLSLAFFVRFIDTRSRVSLWTGSALAALAFIWSYDIGFTTIAAGGALFLFRICADRFSRKSLADFFQFAAFCFGLLLLYLLFLKHHDALWGFIQTNHNLLFKTNKCFYFEPYPLPTLWFNSFHDIPRFLAFCTDSAEIFFAYCNPFILIITVCVLALAFLKGAFHPFYEKILLLTVAGALFFSRSCTTGREDFAMERFSQFIYVLEFALVFYVVRRTTRQRPLLQVCFTGALIFAVLLYLLYRRPHPLDLAVKRTYVPYNFQPLQKRNLISLPDSFRPTTMPRMGNVFVDESQAEVLEALYNFFSEHTNREETIYDFSDKPALYFLLDRPFPGRFPSPMYSIPDDLQREAIGSIEDNRTRYVIFTQLGPFHGSYTPYAHDTVLRYFLISDYLLHHYAPHEEVGAFAILKRGRSGPLDDRWKSLLFRKTMLFDLPYLWGLTRSENVLKNGGIIYQAGRTALVPLRTDEGVIVSAEMPPGEPLPDRCTYILLRIRSGEDGAAALSWGTDADNDFEKEKSVEFNLHASDIPLNYLVRVGNLPGWVWADSIPRITLKAKGAKNHLDIEDITLIDYVSEGGLHSSR